MTEYDIPEQVEELIDQWIETDLTLEIKAVEDQTGNVVWVCYESNAYYTHPSDGKSVRRAGDKRRLELVSDNQNIEREIREKLSQEISTNRPDVMKRQFERLQKAGFRLHGGDE